MCCCDPKESFRRKNALIGLNIVIPCLQMMVFGLFCFFYWDSVGRISYDGIPLIYILLFATIPHLEAILSIFGLVVVSKNASGGLKIFGVAKILVVLFTVICWCFWFDRIIRGGGGFIQGSVLLDCINQLVIMMMNINSIVYAFQGSANLDIQSSFVPTFVHGDYGSIPLQNLYLQHVPTQGGGQVAYVVLPHQQPIYHA